MPVLIPFLKIQVYFYLKKFLYVRMQELQNLKLANWLWVSSCPCSLTSSFIAKACKWP